MSAIDPAAPLVFLTTAFRPDDWIAVFLKSYDTGCVTQRVGPVSWIMEPRFQAWLRYRNAQRFNVYASVNAVTAGRRTRTRDAICAVRHVFLEADHEGSTVLARIHARSDLPPPCYVLHSSANRVHVFWRVEGFDIDTAESLQKQLAKELGTDPAATPASQMTRLPGFFNHKYQPAHWIVADYHDVKSVHTPRQFPKAVIVTPPTVIRTQISLGSSLTPIERARRYIARMPPAIAGEHGDVHTFRLCCRLVRGFELSDDEALSVMAQWNASCEPPWSEVALVDKLRRARRYGREPIAGLLSPYTSA